MIYVYTKSGYQPYNFIPKKIRKKYENMDETLCILEGKAASQRSRYYYQSWDEAVYQAWKDGVKKGFSQHLGVMLSRSVVGDEKWNNINKLFVEFLGSQQDMHLWASDNRFDKKNKVILSNVLTKKLKSKAEKSGVYQNYQIDKKTDEVEYIRTPFLRMFSPKTKDVDRFKNIAQSHDKNSVMNCEQFVCYALCCSGALTEAMLQTLYTACAYENKMDLLHKALGLQEAVSLTTKEAYKGLASPAILFEKNKLDQVAHILVYDGMDHVFELSFGDVEDEWRVKRISLKAYLEREKTVAGCKLSDIPIEAVLSTAKDIIAAMQAQESDQEPDPGDKNDLKFLK